MQRTTLSLVGIGIAALMTGPIMAQECVEFQGIDHCPVGRASLAAAQDGLQVSGLGVQGQDGVASRFEPTTLWKAQMNVDGTSSDSVSFSAVSQGEAAAGLAVESANGRYRLQPSFTGAGANSTYSVMIYENGVLKGALGNLGGSGSQSSATQPTKAMGRQPAPEKINIHSGGVEAISYDEWLDFYWDLILFSISPSGGCNWGVQLNGPVTFALPDGQQVRGDEIRFSEDVRGPGHYPYLGFDTIVTRTTAPRFSITHEFAERR